MQLQKRLTALFMVALLLCSVSITVYAHEVPDISKKGKISIKMTYDKNPVAGGSLTLYRVGDVKADDGNYSFVLTEDFNASKVDLTDISSVTLAKELAQYAQNQKLSGDTKKIGNNGEISFTELDLGLYLLVQNEAANGYNKADPFLVSVPMNEDGNYIYDVDASPKVELQKGPASSTDKTTANTTNTTTTITTNTKLPQTGQLNWPVPVLVVTGLILFSIGWMLRLNKKRDRYEE